MKKDPKEKAKEVILIRFYIYLEIMGKYNEGGRQ